MKKTEFIVQTMDKVITSARMLELKEQLDSDYKYLVGIAISDAHCSPKAVLNLIKIKGIDLLPENFEVAHILTSSNVEPNSKFYTMFEPVSTNGDDMVVRFTDAEWSADYNLQIHLLLTNNPEEVKRGVFN